MKSILLISHAQYGYHTDMYKYYQYLKRKFNVIYVCNDNNLLKIDIENKDIIYLKTKSDGIYKKEFINKIINILRENEFDYIIADYFVGVSKLCILNSKAEKILDIRSETISNNFLKKQFRDILIKIESEFFDKVIILSDETRKKLRISKKKSKIIPLGADCQVDINKITEEIDLNCLYVGTLDGRDIIKTIKGFQMFTDKYGEISNYTIIGYSNFGEEKNIINYIESNGIKNIRFLGRINNNELKEYFEESQIGMSFIPMTKYFNNQPPTKTFEYICNGLVCIATKTEANKKIINNNNGILIEDNEESVFKALEYYYFNKYKFNRFDIIKESKKFSWENIVNELIDYLEK